MNNWKELSLSDIAEVNPRESLQKGMIRKKVTMDSLLPFTKKISGFVLEEYKGGTKFKNGDTLLARITPCLENGKTSFVDILGENEIGFGSTEFIVLREKKNVSDKHFLYYLAISPEIRDIAILSMTGSSGRQRVQPEELIQYKMSIPPLPEQKAIADVLGSLDDKIDLLQRQNKTLEQLAQTLFRQRFIEEAQDEWEESCLLDAIKLVGGGTPKTSEEKYWNGEIFWLSGADITKNHKNFVLFSDKKITESGLNNSSTKLLPENSTVITARGTVGKYCILAKSMSFSQTSYGILPKFDGCYFFTYLLIDHFVSELLSAAYGSIFDTITTRTFQDIKINLPSATVIISFEEDVKPLFDRMKLNQNQIYTLENLRDTLLPKLISGEVRVCYEQFPVQEKILEPFFPGIDNTWLAVLEAVYRLSKLPDAIYVGKTIFQKICYVMAEETALPLNLNFEQGDFGPFSKEVTLVLDRLVQEDMVQIHSLDIIKKIILTQEYEQQREKFLPYITPFEENILKTVDLFCRIENTEQAEEIATVLYAARQLIKENSKSEVSEQQVLDYVLAWKPQWQEESKLEAVACTIRKLETLHWLELS